MPILRRSSPTFAILFSVGVAAFAASRGAADEFPAPPPPPTPLGAPFGPAPAAPAPAASAFTPEQLRELVGPVALYPDVILASLLPATAYPLDVVAAARWIDAQGGQTNAIPEDQPWDASVKAMLQFPDVLRWMSENLGWLEQMGAAVSAQQGEVLQAIQDFRRTTRAAGNLASDEHLRVVEQRPAEAPPTAPTVIVIEPANPEIVYVPVYDPYVIVRSYPVRPAYPLLSFGFGFYLGSAGPWAWHDLRWGWWGGSSYDGWGLYLSNSYYYWGTPRSSAWYVGPYRPRPWVAPYRRSYVASPYSGSATTGIRRTTVFSPRRGGSAQASAGTRASYVRPPTDPRPTPRSFVRTPTRAPTSTTTSPIPGIGTGTGTTITTPRRIGPRTLPSPSPTTRRSPWTLPATPVLPTVPPTGTTVRPPTITTPRTRTTVVPPVTTWTSPSARPWAERGHRSLLPPTTDVPTVRSRVVPPVAAQPTPSVRVTPPSRARSFPVPPHLPDTNWRRNADRGRSSLTPPTTPPPPPKPRHR